MSFKTIVIIVLGIAFLYGLFTVGSPFLLAIVFALFLEPLVLLLIKYLRVNRIVSVTLVCSVFTLLMMGVVYLIGLKVTSELVAFWKNAPEYINEANDYVQETIQRTRLFYDSLSPEMAEQVQSGIETGLGALTEGLNGIMAGISGYFVNIAKAIPDLLIYTIVFFVALFLFSYGLPTLKYSFLSMFEEKSQHKVESVLLNLRKAIFGFLRAQLVLSALTYCVAFIGLLLLDVQYPLAVALVIIVVDILPILGTGSVLVPWAVYNFFIDRIGLGVGILVLFLVITAFRRAIEPKILAESIGIGALSALISLYVGFKLVGVVGLFLGPIIIIVYQAMRKVGLLDFKIKLE